MMRRVIMIIAGLLLFSIPLLAQEAEVDSLAIAPSDTTVAVGDEITFEATAFDSVGVEIEDAEVTWSSSNSLLGSIDAEGLFEALSEGTVYVTATSDSVSDSTLVTVTAEEPEPEDPVAASVTISPEEAEIAVGDSVQFEAAVLDSEEEEIDGLTVTWSLTDSTVASIDSTGLVIGLAEGETKVNASVGEVSGEAEVTVVNEIVLEPGVNTVNFLRQKADGKITKFGGTITEGETVTIGGIPSPLNFMNGTKIFFPENSLSEDITITFKLPQIGKVQGKTVVFPDSVLTAVTFEVSVNDSVVSPYTFEVPLEVSLPFKRGLLSKLGIEPEDLGMFFVTESGELVEEGITDISLDEESNRITGIIEHFSDIALAQKTNVPTVAEENNLPTGFSLSANYPNPFNPETSIDFVIPETSHVSLTIYNALGQHVKTLASEVKSAGSYTVVWDGRDDAGRLVNSGVFFYRMKAGNIIRTNKLMFLK